MNKTSQDLPIVIGRVIGTYRASNSYAVQISNAQPHAAIYFGDGSNGALGVRHAGGLAAGSLVVVALTPGTTPWIILASFGLETDTQADAYNPHQLVWPQSFGYRGEVDYASQITDTRVKQLVEFGSDGLRDMVNGEWARLSYFAAAMGVEHFRSWLSTSPFCGVWAFDDSFLRIRGLEFEQQTAGTERGESLPAGVPIGESRRFWAPGDTLPRQLELHGRPYAGSQQLVLPPGDQPAFGLFSQHLTEDGSLVIKSARQISLVRTLSIPVALPAEPTDDPDAQEEQAELEMVAITEEPRQLPTLESEFPVLAHAQSAHDLIDGLTRWTARQGVEDRPSVWQPGEEPTDEPILLASGMWGSAPSDVTVDLGERGSQRFYLGRSSINIMPDGSILLENTHGAQIMASGPNIILSAPGDIIQVAGGSHQVMANRSASVVAEGPVQVSSNTDRVDVKAEGRLSMLGGNDGGEDGVLIESRSAATAPKLGDGRDGTSAGLMIKTPGMLSVIGGGVEVNAGSRYTCTAGLNEINGDRLFCRLNEFHLSDDGVDPMLHVTRRQVFLKSLVAEDNVAVGGQLLSRFSILCNSQIVARSVIDASEAGNSNDLFAQLNEVRDQVDDSINAFDNASVNPATTLELKLTGPTLINASIHSKVGFAWYSSEEYRAPDDYALPQARWQEVSFSGDTWEFRPVVSPYSLEDTQAYPGTATWRSGGKMYRRGESKYFDPETGTFTPSQDSELTDTTQVPLSAFIRSP